MNTNTPNKPWYSGLTHAVGAFGFSVAGLRAAAAGEVAFRQELVLWCLLTPLALWLPHSLTQSAVLMASMTLVLIVELVNSAIEAAVDRISLERHELAKRAKDIGSAAVLIALINCVLCWGLVLYEVVR